MPFCQNFNQTYLFLCLSVKVLIRLTCFYVFLSKIYCTKLPVPASSLRIYSSEAIFAFVSATLS